MKLNNRRRHLEARYIFLIIILIITIYIGIMSVVIDDDRKLTPIEGGAKDILVTLQKVIYMPFQYIVKKLDNYNDMKSIYKKYKKLDNNQEKMNLIIEENRELKRELLDMQELLNLNNIMKDYKLINATVITRNVGDWYNTLTIDKGFHDGVKDNMAVIVNEGLIGYIIKTTTFTSEVKLITTNDLNSKISVGIYTGNNLTYGLLNGYDYNNNMLLINDIIDGSLINIGSSVITSGLSNKFPKGILIGKVDSIVSGEYGISKTIKIKPSADFNDIRYVSIIKR